ncbi:signal sequence receptor alpha subunit [Cordyceps javanica]|uniref:Signal sequence receptor alpha subunit n=1 Tax=Cordyceps javanica TaxID=43265 RepID=A0A545UVD1_9HYPO|nr:signal sequence receptor alpha subunit [Cordyceps javanica]TQW05253.1 signal sequence receptor alpha subunit [Cordyceps javanica]
MLDTFEIITTSGVVLWSRTYAPVNPSVINNFIADTFIEERHSGNVVQSAQSASANPAYKTDHHTLKWTMVKELGVIFVVVYRSLLHLSWVDKLVDNIRTIFVSLYGEQVKKPHTTLVECHGFDDYFDQQLRELDKSSTADPSEAIDDADSSPDGKRLSAPGLTYRGRAVSGDAGKDAPSADSTPTTSRPSTPASSNLVVAKAGPVAKMSRRARKAKHGSAAASSGDESTRSKKGTSGKKGRKWDADGFADEEDDVQLDYSAQDGDGVGKSSAVESVDSTIWGTSAKGKFVLRDLGDEVQGILASAEAEKAAASRAASAKAGILGSGVNAISGLFRNVVGGKTLTTEDLAKAMKGMEEHLLRKNVAREAAVRLCEGVEKELVGTKTGSFEGKLPIQFTQRQSY